MIFRQIFEPISCTYSYLIASRVGGEAILIDSVFEDCNKYVKLLNELKLKLVFALDTHTHADHVTAMGILKRKTACQTAIGQHSHIEQIDYKVKEGEKLNADGVELSFIYTPGHTDCSYSFLCDQRVFTGDTLLIRGSGRCDFQSGDARAQYDSIFNKLLKLPEDTQVYPAHDYNGMTSSTIAEEKACNPRLQVSSEAEYVKIMDQLKLPYPRLMDLAVPANLKCGLL